MQIKGPLTGRCVIRRLFEDAWPKSIALIGEKKTRITWSNIKYIYQTPNIHSSLSIYALPRAVATRAFTAQADKAVPVSGQLVYFHQLRNSPSCFHDTLFFNQYIYIYIYICALYICAL